MKFFSSTAKLFTIFLLSLILLQCFATYAGAVTVTPSTWNIIGLDSNDVSTGPNKFPVGAKVCGGTPGGNDSATFYWDSGGTEGISDDTYIKLRPGTNNPVSFTYGVDGCADAFFEVEITRSSSAYGRTRRYHITSGSVSTLTPRELYIERLVSQARNAITNLEFGDPEPDGTCDEGTPLTSVSAGGSFSIVVGSTNCIRMSCYTATAGYQQLESFVSFPNTIFQVLGVSTTYSADTTPNVDSGDPILYADACYWENDPNSPNYLSCNGDGKIGGTMQVTYKVKILSTGSGQETLTSLVHDYSGSSFHYNSDYETGGRTMYVIDPETVTIAKKFRPNPASVNGISALTFTVSNPNAGVVSGVNFVDNLPANMTVADPPNATTSGCGTPTFSPVAGNDSISFADGSVAGYGSCTAKVNVTTTTTGSFFNTTNNVFVGTVDTGDAGNDSLTVNTAPTLPPPPAACNSPTTLASWTFSGGETLPSPSPSTQHADVATATASFTNAPTFTNAIDTTQGGTSGANSWYGTGFHSTTADPGANAVPNWQFDIDTSEFGGARISFDYALLTSGDWAAGNNNHHYVYSNDGTGWSTNQNLSGGSPVVSSKGSWQTGVNGLTVNAASTGTSTTSFQIHADTRNSNKPAAAAYIDDIVIEGCARIEPPTITKSFSPDPVAVGGTSTLTFTVTNINTDTHTNYDLTGIGFNDSLPSGMVVKDPLNVTNNCGGSLLGDGNDSLTGNDSLIMLSSGSVSTNSSCTVSVDVVVADAGPHNNISGFVTSSEGGTNNTSSGIATDSVTAISPPTISKQFAPNPIIAGNDSTLTFIITNPNLDFPISGVSFTDTLPISPAALKVASPPNATASAGCGSPTFSPSGNDSSLTFSGGAIPAGDTCTVTVDIATPLTTGVYTNISGAVTHLIGGENVGTSYGNDSLTVFPAHPAIAILKQVSDSASGPWKNYVVVAGNDSIYYRFTIENPGDVDLASVSVTDPDVTLSGCSWNPLLKYDSQTCTGGPVTATVSEKVNTATVSGTYSSTPYSGNDSATYATYALGFDKSVTQSAYTAGNDSLNYSYVISNTGNAILGGTATVSDNKATVSCPSLTTATLIAGGAGDGDNYLDPGEQLTCTATYAVTAGDVTAKSITNIASGSLVAGNDSYTAGNDSVTIYLAPDLAASKNNDTADLVLFGNDFDWDLFVSNSTSAGSALFTNGQTLLTDQLPATGATYALGAVKTAGVTGTINCAIGGNDSTVTCLASGDVTIPDMLQGTITVAGNDSTVTGLGTNFDPEVTAGSIIEIAGVPYTVLSRTSDTELTLTTNYAGAGASGIKLPGSFNVPITVTPTVGGSLVNPRGGGVCAADPGDVLLEIDDAVNNLCADTVTVQGLPSLTVVKTVQAYSDPINDTSDPKAIPGSYMTYTILVTNTGTGTADDNTTVVTDQVPANTDLFVGDLSGVGTGPVLFVDGNDSGGTASGLSYTFTSLNYGNDSLFFSGNSGADGYAKNDVTADGNDCDPSVTDLKVLLNGILRASDGSNHPSFSLKFRVRVE